MNIELKNNLNFDLKDQLILEKEALNLSQKRLKRELLELELKKIKNDYKLKKMAIINELLNFRG